MNTYKLFNWLMIFSLIIISSFVAAKPVQAAGQVTLLFFDRNGIQMNINQIRSVSNNGSSGFDNDALLNPSTLQVINLGPLFNSGGTLAFTVPSQPVALAFNWPTQPSGFSLIILDNGGSGFTSGGTVNFTYRAALDEKRRLDSALRTRPDYQPSLSFQNAYNSAVSHINTANNSSQESIKGSEGQLALDQLAIAYSALLSEYGPAYTRAHLENRTPWLGVTIDTTSNYQANLDLAASLTQPYGWVRVVFDLGKGPSDYDALIRYAKSKNLKILGEPIDSYWDKNYTRAQYKQRFIDFLTYYNGTNAPALDGWEVGNEVNGSWLSTAIANKVSDAATEVRNRQPNAKTVLTLFWQINTDTKNNSIFNWMAANLPASTIQKIDVLLVSQYIEQAPMGLAFDQVFTTLQTKFPDKQIGLGELGYWIPDQQYWWAIDQDDPMGAGLRGVAAQYYPSSLAYPSSIGGGFWWNFISEFSADPQLQNILSNLRDEIGEGIPPTSSPTPTFVPTQTPTPKPTVTQTPTPSLTSSPTAIPSITMTASPTAMPTQTATPINMAHSGRWVAKGIIPASANYKDLFQENISVPGNSDFQASIWIRGIGSVKLNIWNGSWGTNIANRQCTASNEWTLCTLEFNTGNYAKLVFDLETAYNGAGTVYLDDAFLSSPGGENKLNNADFESGNTSWQTNSGSTWSIIQNPE